MKYVLSLISLWLLSTPTAAHEPGQSYLFLRVYDHSIEVRMELAAADVDQALHLGLDPANRITAAQIELHLRQILSYTRSHLAVESSGHEMNLRYTGFARRWLGRTDYVLLTFVIDDLARIPDHLDVTFSALFDENSRHRNMLVIEHNWRTSTFNNEANVSLIFSPSNPRQTLDLDSASVLRGFLGFIRLGAWHIWIGLDHILFLVALALPSVLYREGRKWKPVDDFRRGMLNILAIVTCFTIAHSITLSLAALDVVRVPSRLVESIIALSIAVAALHNVFPRFAGREWVLAFVFGLFHGFGFANVLRDIGLERTYLVHSLLGFNLGVEAGQIVIIAAVFPALFLLRRRSWYPRLLLQAGSLLLVAVALVWFAERALDVPLYQYALKLPGYLWGR